MLRYGDPGEVATLAGELESLGYSALWIPDVGGDVFGPLANLLGATSTATIATGILNVWMHTPDETATQHAALTVAHGPRFLCGIGISHRPFIDHVNTPGTYQNPVETMAGFLDGLDAAEVPLAAGDRVDRPLGPKMLELAGHASLALTPISSPLNSRRRLERRSAPTASSPASKASCSTTRTGRGRPPAST